ncbi:hypothetical protein RchiOBHm_Chr7g0215391 [Rosa chinensis]|uniref:Uncharacterized protein n=1 Tax=Rosa chinensis TaxID=74649 RepID=A0A2P6PBH0_ROSCH|nr:uncharacterized protein LOC112179291 [Rosa chinensis]XP_024173438.1 uncharacterized protein LOC112179291 [Rosa chinensis]XP_024173439.1 uncharacterized protein LOC112179291 [Rosa chinensis]XP_040367714.1 uncharacterized protein LOC112179291 [Rosa chinensis]PRQ19271.1 hypothetical protein RchiOBHm_Chr7g0215391 [Rosa chinensis]
MVNSSLDNNALGDSVVNSPISHKQSTLRMKKVALRDVQNDNRIYMPNHPENSCNLGRQVGDLIKVTGTKIVTPERPRSSPCHQFSNISGLCEQALGKRRIQDVTDQSADCLNSKRHLQKQAGVTDDRTKKQENESPCAPSFAPNFLTSPISFSPGKPPVPLFLGKSSNASPGARSRHLKFTPDRMVSNLVDPKRNNDENRTERFLCLQNLLKLIDESNQGEYIQMLRCLSSSELNRHAVELEKRSMLLSVEEAKEIQRMKALNILVKSPMTSNSPLTVEQVQSKK